MTHKKTFFFEISNWIWNSFRNCKFIEYFVFRHFWGENNVIQGSIKICKVKSILWTKDSICIKGDSWKPSFVGVCMFFMVSLHGSDSLKKSRKIKGNGSKPKLWPNRLLLESLMGQIVLSSDNILSPTFLNC